MFFNFFEALPSLLSQIWLFLDEIKYHKYIMDILMSFSRYAVFKVRCRGISVIRSGDKGIRTLDPLLAKQVLSQLSYTPIFNYNYSIKADGLKWTRTTDLTLIRRAL